MFEVISIDVETIADYLEELQKEFKNEDLHKKEEEETDSDDEWYKKKDDETEEVHMADITTKAPKKKKNFLKFNKAQVSRVRSHMYFIQKANPCLMDLNIPRLTS